MRGLLLAGVVGLLAGCGAASASEEAKAAETLAPKPPTPEQQAQMERVKSQFPQGGGPQPGHS